MWLVGAAFFSFLALLIRDYAVFEYFHDERLFYNVNYYTNIFIVLMTQTAVYSPIYGSQKYAFAIITFSVITAALAIALTFHVFDQNLLTISVTYLFAVAASSYVSHQFFVKRGIFAFMARSRDATINILTAFLLFLGFGLMGWVMAAVAVSVFFVLMVFVSGRRSAETRPARAPYMTYLFHAVMANLGFLILYCWALVANNQDISFLGYDAVFLTRVSFYLFSLIQLPSFLFVGRTLPRHLRRWALAGLLGCLAAMTIIVVFMISMPSTWLFMPILCCATVYLGQASINANAASK